MEACEVRGELEGRWCALGVPGPTPTSSFPTSVPFLYRTRAGTEPSTMAVGRKGCWRPLLCDSGRPSPQTPSSASCREWHPGGWCERLSPLYPCLTQPPLHTHPYRWFHGKISGQEAIQQLQPPEDGLFLVRESARHPGDYVLCVSFGRDVIHYRVLHRDGHLTIDEAVCFCNLMDMVEVTCGARLGKEGWKYGWWPQELSLLSLELGSPPQGALCSHQPPLSFHSTTPTVAMETRSP